MIMLLTTSLKVTSWHDCWFQVARSVQSGDHFLRADMSVPNENSASDVRIWQEMPCSALGWTRQTRYREASGAVTLTELAEAPPPS